MRYLLLLIILAVSFGVMQGSASITLRPVINKQDFNYDVRVINYEALNQTQLKAVSTEKWRQFFGLVLIAAAAALTASGILSWMSYFFFILTASNLFSYFWIWMMLGWPGSIFEWTIVFLMPKTAMAPLIAPFTASLIICIISLMMIRTLDRFRVVNFDPQHWGPLLLAIIFWMISFINKTSANMTEFPQSYTWALFIIGTIFAIAGATLIYFDFFKRKLIFK